MSLKKVKRMARKLDREGGLYGFNFDDLDITSKSISANGDFAGLGEMDLIINFNNRGKLRDLRMSIDYDDFDGRLVQGYSFSNYKKFSKSTTKSRYENLYSKALNDLGSGIESRMQDGIDAIERMPGVKDMYAQLIMFDGSPSSFWT